MLFAILVLAAVLPAFAASPVAYWRFEGTGDDFFQDAGPKGIFLEIAKAPNSPAEPRQEALPASGAGAGFAGRGNASSASFTEGDMSSLMAPYNPAFALQQFSFEAFVHLRGAHPDDKLSTIAAMGSPGPEGAAWILGVSGESSPRGARTLLFIQQFRPGEWAKENIVVVNSEIVLSANTDYFIAVVVDAANTADGVTFYVKDLTNNGPLEIAAKARPAEAARVNEVEAPFWIGNQKGYVQSQWDGLIDEVRLSPALLNEGELLVNSLGR